MKKVELLAPAKDLEKAKVAMAYGADAVYVGGENYSLRYRAANFSYEDLKELCILKKEYGCKVYVTINIIFHDEDFAGIVQYLKYLNEIGVDGLIMSCLSLIPLVRKYAPNLAIHISTQDSIYNFSAIEALKRLNVQRVVLARECSIEEIEKISTSTDMEIETFIHGGMCSNFSGRCLLSNYMTNRDANRGGCAHSCRWKYDLYQGSEKVSSDDCPFSMSSKDLKAVEYIERMIKAGVSCLKIEGRMKSEYYIAQIVRIYRKMIDLIYTKGHLNNDDLLYFQEELIKGENRESDDGFLSGNCDQSKHLYGVDGDYVSHDYVASVIDYDPKRSMATIEVKNVFENDDILEAFGPNLDNREFLASMMYDQDFNYIARANKPSQIIYIRTFIPLSKGDMIRKIGKHVD